MAKELKLFIVDLVCNIGGYRENLFQILLAIQKREKKIDISAMELITQKTGIPLDEIKAMVGFYPFFSEMYHGDNVIYLNKSSTAHESELQNVEQAFKREVGINFGEVTEDKKFGLFYSSCIELCEQKPVAVINDIVVTNLTDAKVASLVSQLKLGVSLKQIVENNANNL